jgi:beta-phosphoglucomutase-like phosphatase (HAD superfamily)
MSPARLGLPAGIRACLFDLDGVLTATQLVHARAWKELFDGFLRGWDGEGFAPFTDDDYRLYVDGRRRRDGVHTFLVSRGIALTDAEEATIAHAKDVLVVERLRHFGVERYEGSVAYVQAAGAAGLRRAVVSASRHGEEVLRAARLEDEFELRVDGVVAGEEHLRSKPAPDMYLYAARRLGEAPAACAVFEDALVGVEAGRAGGFGFVVGIARGTADPAELVARGADIAVADLAELLV